jgi:hypothetical protein
MEFQFLRLKSVKDVEEAPDSLAIGNCSGIDDLRRARPQLREENL